ncbi:MAG TPA: hypothetical protein VF158_02425 [Longimicrobiales bacterium]
MALRPIIGLLVVAPLLTACSDDEPPAPEIRMAEVAGDYVAEGDYGVYSFTTTADGQTTDWLAEGASVHITLTADGRTSGRLFVPGGDEDGSDFEADLAGTWSLIGDIVEFSHEADTFIRDMAFHVEDGRLSGDETFDDARVRLVLERR